MFGVLDGFGFWFFVCLLVRFFCCFLGFFLFVWGILLCFLSFFLCWYFLKDVLLFVDSFFKLLQDGKLHEWNNPSTVLPKGKKAAST